MEKVDDENFVKAMNMAGWKHLIGTYDTRCQEISFIKGEITINLFWDQMDNASVTIYLDGKELFKEGIRFEEALELVGVDTSGLNDKLGGWDKVGLKFAEISNIHQEILKHHQQLEKGIPKFRARLKQYPASPIQEKLPFKKFWQEMVKKFKSEE